MQYDSEKSVVELSFETMRIICLFVFLVILSPATFSQTKIAVVDIQKILDSLPDSKKEWRGIRELEILTNKDLDTLESLYAAKLWHDEIEINYPGFENVTTDWVVRFWEIIDKRKRQLEIDLSKAREDCYKKHELVIDSAMHKVAKRLKLDAVLDQSKLLYSNGEEDITNQIISEILRTN